MEKRLLQLEQSARRLEPTPQQRKQAQQAVLQYTEAFLNQLENAKTYNPVNDNGIGLLNTPISEKSIGIKKAIKLIKHNVDRPALNPASGGHLGYIPGGGIYYSALGDYLADVTNRYAGVFYASPGAVRMENMLIRWAAQLMGFPNTAAGNLTSGGSISNLIAICTARDAQKITANKLTTSVIYLTQQAHHSVQKAIRIAGLGECVFRYVEMDPQFRMQAPALHKAIKEDKKNGLNPFLIIASAGTTDTGAIDPLTEIAAVARKTKCWYHIDAAYGGFFMLTREGKKKMQGIELADSVTADAHKSLFLPYGTGIVLVKNAAQLYKTFFYTASYMQDALEQTEELSPADLSPELTRHFRGMRLWLPLQLHGVKPFRDCLEEKLLLAKYFHKKIKALGFESEVEPELSVVVYRFVPESGSADEFNKKLCAAVQRDGRIFISSTIINGNYTLRFACLVFRTHKKQVDQLLNIISREKRKLEKR
ncbi:MAG: aminotransferase class V-fold PLP-dependent enzyme [Dinghuibacter sp.]|nr:aminotransferase class V-fold PLP-dependent enzyme [Dinghuibacter sp.]